MIDFLKKLVGLHVHAWSQWETTESGEIIRTLRDGRKAVVGSYMQQKRTCSTCGLVEIKSNKTTIDD